MKIEYHVKFWDVLLFQISHQLFSLIPQIGLLLFCAFVSFPRFREGNYIDGIFAAIVAYIVLFFIQSAFIAIYAFFKSSKSVLTTHIVEVHDDHFYEETRFNKSIYYWSGVLKIVFRPGFFAVYVASDLAHIIPNRAFKSKEERLAFTKAIESKIEEGRIV